MFEDLKPSRKTLSCFYIATIFSFLLFQQIVNIISDWANFFSSIVARGLSMDLANLTVSWLFFFLSCFIITILVYKFITKPLGFYIDQEGAPWWELVILAFLVIGFYIYMLNQTFPRFMPATWPEFYLKLLGARNSPVAAGSGWGFVPWLWNVGPILYMYIRTQLVIKKADDDDD